MYGKRYTEQSARSNRRAEPGRLPTSAGVARSGSVGKPLHRLIYEELLSELQRGLYAPGDRLPSEALLCERFSASRITIAKAIHTLQREHLVVRRPGSGTYVEGPSQEHALRFGLLIPELGTTEIFEPICQGMMSTPLGKSHSLIWGHAAALDEEREQAAEQLCRQYIDQKVSGVFFAPIEFTATRDHTNRNIIAMLRRAAIPIVLLDRCFEPYPHRSSFDLIGIDNFRAGFVLTEHLLRQGAGRIVFVHRPHSAATVQQRVAGFREALRSTGSPCGVAIADIDFGNGEQVASMLDAHRPDGVVCANDLTAATLMRTMLDLGIRIPQEVRMVSIDDVSYAKFLPVPLTTLRQNTAEIGASALWTMLNRIEHPHRPARDVLADFKLVIRESCGARQRPEQTSA